MKSFRICFYSPKGGAGKTTGICNVAGAFAMFPKASLKVLVIDTDPSFSASASFPIKDDEPEIFYPELMQHSRKKGMFPSKELLMKTITPAFGGRDYSKEHPDKRKARENIFIAPVRMDINSLEIEELDNALTMEKNYGFFNSFFSPLYDEFNIILIDAPGQRVGSIYLNAIAMSEYVVAPSEFDIYSPICITDVQQIIERANGFVEHDVKFLGYYMSKFHGTRVREQELLNMLRKENHKFLDAAIKDSSIIRIEQGEKDVVTLAQIKSQESEEFMKLSAEILSGIKRLR